MMYQRFFQIIKEKGIKPSDISAATGISSTVFSEWKSGKSVPKTDKLIKISKFLNVSLDYLVGISNTEKTNSKVEKITADKESKVKIPVLGCVHAGEAVEAVEEILDYEEISEELAATGEFFGLVVRGDSMQPLLQDGDIVIIRKQPDVESGDIAVVMIENQDATIKRVKKYARAVDFVPENKAYNTLTFSNNDILSLPVVVLGKVVESRRTY